MEEGGLQVVRAAQYGYAALASAFVVGILLQVYFIGLGLFSSSDYKEVHAAFGWLLHLVPPFILLAAALARAGRNRLLQTAALAVLIFFVPILAAVGADAPLTAAFHPVAAMLAFGLAIFVSRGAARLIRSNEHDPSTTLLAWVLVGVLVAVYLFVSLAGGPEA